MRKILVIAVRDYKAAVRTKSFIIGLLLMPLLMFGGGAVQVVTQRYSEVKDKHFAVVDRTREGKVFAYFKEAADKRNEMRSETGTIDPETGKQLRSRFILESVPPSPNVEEQRLELSEQVRSDRYWGFVEIGPDALNALTTSRAPGDQPSPLRYQTNHPTYEEFPAWAQQQLVLSLLKTLHGPDIKLPQGIALRREGLSERDAATGAIIDPPIIHQIARFLIPAVLVGLLFMMIMLSSAPATHGVVEEKMQRIAEVLLGSARPFELMLGKLVGIMGVSLTMSAVYLGGAYYAAYRYGFTEMLPAPVLAWFIVFQALAVVMYGSLFLAIGAAATDIKETQTLVLPIMLIACTPLFVLRNALEDPNGALVVGLSFFPPITPMLMMARLAIPPGPPLWQPVLAVVLVLGVTAFCVWAAGRIFRVGILMQGKGAKLGQLAQWVFKG